MTINEIKNLTNYLSEEEVKEIKKEIKSKEDILKSGDIDEEELIQVLNTLFAILVIEKTLDSEIEDIENIKDELEEELLEAYQEYDDYMSRYKKDKKKKKKKNWLLHFLFLSDDIKNKKQNYGSATKTINSLKQELNELKQQKSDENLRKVVDREHRDFFDSFCDCPKECKHPHNHRHHHDSPIEELEKSIKKAFSDEAIKRGEHVDREETFKNIRKTEIMKNPSNEIYVQKANKAMSKTQESNSKEMIFEETVIVEQVADYGKPENEEPKRSR